MSLTRENQFLLVAGTLVVVADTIVAVDSLPGVVAAVEKRVFVA